MNNGINHNIRKNLYVFIGLIVFYIFIQLSVFIYSQLVLNTNVKIISNDSVFSDLHNNLMEMESVFLNYNLGYIPSSKKVKSIINDNNRILLEIDNLLGIADNPSRNDYFDQLRSNIIILHVDILSFLRDHDESAKKYIQLKDINEQFFVCRLLLSNYRKLQNTRVENNIRKMKTLLYINIAAILILIIVAAISILTAVNIKKFVEQKIKFLQKALKSFADNERTFHIDYENDDEIKDVVETLNSVTTTISRQHEKIVEGEKRFRYLYNNSPDALLLLNSELEIVDCNESSLKIFGYPDFETINTTQRENFLPNVQSDGSALDDTLIKNIEICKEEGSNAFEFTLKRYNGEVFPAEITLGKLYIDKLLYFQATIRDLTNEKIQAEKMVQSQKMETIGTLAGGLAHDFNNILSGITGPVSLIDFMILNEDYNVDEMKNYINTITQSADRAKTVVNQLLSLSRKNVFSKSRVNLNNIINDVIEIGKNSFDKSVKIEFVSDYSEAFIEADQTYLEQALLNIMINSAHAMTIMRKETERWGGLLKVDLSLIEKNSIPTHRINGNLDANYWMITISDSGIGMSKDVVSKIFTPFYTTKEKGMGTGLGLAMVYNTVDQHGGFINVYSEEKIGTSFNIYLPCIDKSDLRNSEENITIEIPQAEGRILVVDDEEIMRNLAKDILERCGYEVVEAVDGIDGIENFEKNIDSLKAVILDIVMPRLGGAETFYKMREINKTIPIIITSGFKEDHRVKELIEAGADDFLKKPYNLKDFIKIVNKIESNKSEFL